LPEAFAGELAEHRDDTFRIMHVGWRDVDRQRDTVLIDAQVNLDAVDLLAAIEATAEAARGRPAGAAVDDDSRRLRSSTAGQPPGAGEHQKPWGSSGSYSLEHEPSTVRSMTCSPLYIRPCPPTMSSAPHLLPQPELPHGFCCSQRSLSVTRPHQIRRKSLPCVGEAGWRLFRYFTSVVVSPVRAARWLFARHRGPPHGRRRAGAVDGILSIPSSPRSGP